MFSYFVKGNVRRNDAISNVRSIYYSVDDKDSTLIGLNYLETDTMRMYISPLRKLQKIWTNKFEATLYPMTQIPPGKDKLESFGWFSYVRPLNKDDLYEWRPKAAGTELKKVQPRVLPKQRLDDADNDADIGSNTTNGDQKTAEQTAADEGNDSGSDTTSTSTNASGSNVKASTKAANKATKKKSAATTKPKSKST